MCSAPVTRLAGDTRKLQLQSQTPCFRSVEKLKALSFSVCAHASENQMPPASLLGGLISQTATTLKQWSRSMKFDLKPMQRDYSLITSVSASHTYPNLNSRHAFVHLLNMKSTSKTKPTLSDRSLNASYRVFLYGFIFQHDQTGKALSPNKNHT